MKISGFQKLTLLDFPDKLACIIFTQGCNFNCQYCQNSGLIGHENEYLIDEEEIFDYLDKRKKVIDGLVVSGGEPTVQKDLIRFIKRVKDHGFLVKLDTNGSNPKVLKELIDNNLVDYIAMDIKNIFALYKEVTYTNPNVNNLKESIKLISNSNIDHEFRTTIIKNIHDIDNILKICSYVDTNQKMFLQNFEQSENVKDKKLESFNKDELIDIQKKVRERFPNVKVRGV
jgi:pyruvate formate lyase activating enzyme